MALLKTIWLLYHNKLSRCANFAFSGIDLVHDENLLRFFLISRIMNRPQSMYKAVCGGLNLKSYCVIHSLHDVSLRILKCVTVTKKSEI